MNILQILIITSGLLTLVGCSKSNDMNHDAKVMIDASAYTVRTPALREWVYIADRSGKVLDVQKLLPGSVLTLSAETEDDSLSLTRVSDIPSFSYDVISIVSIGISASTSVVLPGVPPSEGSGIDPNKGSFRMLLNNYNAPEEGQFLTVNSEHVLDIFSGAVGNQTADITIAMQADSSTVIASSVNANKQPVYKFYKGVKTGDYIVDDFSSFIRFPRELPISYSGTVDGSVRGYKGSGINYIFSKVGYSGQSPALGYLTGYDKYRTLINVHPSAKVVISYDKYGSIPTSSPEFLSANLTKSGSTIGNSKYTISGPFTYGRADWYETQSSSSVLWSVYFSRGYQPVTSDIPAEILSELPNLHPENLVCSAVHFLDRKDGTTLTSLTGGLLEGIEFFVEHEYYDYSLTN